MTSYLLMGDNAKTEQSNQTSSVIDEPDIYEPVPLARIDWDCLTDVEARKQKNLKRQYGRKAARSKIRMSKRTLKFATWMMTPTYESQSGIGGYMSQKWNELCSKVALPGMDKVMNYGENLLLLFLNLRDCNSWTAAFAAITMYIKLHCKDQALATQVLDYIKTDCFDELKFWSSHESTLVRYKSQSEESEPKPSFWKSERNPFEMIFSSWDSIKNSPIRNKILGLISTALAVGMLSETRELAPTIRGLTLFRVHACKGQTTMVDLMGTIISTMKFFVEKGYKCFEVGSLEPFLYDEDTAFDFQEDYNRIVSNFEYVKVGSYKDTQDKCPWADEKDFERDLLQVIDDCKAIRKSATPRDRVLMDRYYETLSKIYTAFELLRTSGGLREAPFSFCIFGASGIGKSTIVNNLITYSLQKIMWERGIKDYEVDPNSICTLNEMDKYHSDYKSHIQAVLLDDFANAKADVTNVNPSINVINFINNVARTAIMAEAELKGKIQLLPLVVAATTNVKDLDARTYSNEPVSILRRFQLHIEARVKPEYLKDAEAAFIDGKQLALDAADGILCPDAWEFDVYEWFSGASVRACSKPIMYRDPNETDPNAPKKQANKIGMATLLQIFDEYIRDHVRIQKSVVKSSKDIFKQKLCPHGKMTHYCEYCQHGLTDHVDEEESAGAYESQSSFFNKLYDEYMMNTSYSRWENYLPSRVFDNFKLQIFSCVLNSRAIIASYFSLSSLIFTFNSIAAPQFISMFCAIYGMSALLAMKARKDYVVRKLQESRDMLPRVVRNIRDMDARRGKQLFVFFSAVIALYVLYTNFMKSVPTKMVEQGNQFSVHMEKENPWLSAVAEPVPLPLDETTNNEKLSNKVRKNQVHLTLGREMVNGLFICSNVLIVPKHAVPKETTFVVKAVYSRGFVSGTNFEKSVHKDDVYQIPNCDLALIYVSCGGDRPNLVKHFPTTPMRATTPTTSIYNSGEELVEGKHRIYGYDQINTGRAVFRGAKVRYDNNTFDGQCGTTHLTTTTCASIIGFHAAGIANTPEGALTTVTMHELEKGINVLCSRPHVLQPLSEGEMVTQSYGIDFTPTDHIAAKSPLNYQETAQIEVYGTLPNSSVRPKSSVVKSPISDVVEEVTGVPNKHGKPANCRKREDGGIPSWEPYQKYVAGVGNAYQEFPSDVMEWAMEDYKKGFDDLFKSDFGKDLLSRVKVLDDVEATSGIDGMKFVDAMKPATSMGYPVNKSKVNYMELFPGEYKEISLPRIMDDETLRLAARARTCWLNDQRSYDIFKTCTKDEPTKLTKLKVRCFQAAPVSLQMNIRKYFLTMCHLLSMSSKTSECAVGINAQGRGWHEINEHMIRFGSDRVVAGDFKAYDQHMSAGMVMASYNIFRHIAKAAGFTDVDLRMMRGCATEVAYPVMSLNGELIKLFGSNPSGQNLTVYTNSIVNSLYHRCVFRILYPKFKGRFTDAVSLMSYGDDVKMSVSKDFPLYNHTKIQEVFNSFGIDYTMAEKEAESVPFITHEEADFLKRKSRWEPSYSYVDDQGVTQTGMWIAMLDKESIFKSLHCNLASKTQAQEEVAIQCICGALREMFFYGKEEFDAFHEQMKEVVTKMGWMSSMPEQFWMCYESRELAWMDQNEVTKFESQGYVSQSFVNPASGVLRPGGKLTFMQDYHAEQKDKIEDKLASFRVKKIAKEDKRKYLILRSFKFGGNKVLFKDYREKFMEDPYSYEALRSLPPQIVPIAAEYQIYSERVPKTSGDLLLRYTTDEHDIVILVELKSSRNGFRKGRKQLLKQLEAFREFNQSPFVATVLMSPYEMEVRTPVPLELMTLLDWWHHRLHKYCKDTLVITPQSTRSTEIEVMGVTTTPGGRYKTQIVGFDKHTNRRS